MAKEEKLKGKSNFDLEKAKTMVGQTVLIGLTYYSHGGEFQEQKQLHGRIISVEDKAGFTIELEGKNKGEIYRIPPDLRSFRAAAPGEYRERSTGEVVINPDLITTWEVTRPPSLPGTDKQRLTNIRKQD